MERQHQDRDSKQRIPWHRGDGLTNACQLPSPDRYYDPGVQALHKGFSVRGARTSASGDPKTNTPHSGVGNAGKPTPDVGRTNPSVTRSRHRTLSTRGLLLRGDSHCPAP